MADLPTFFTQETAYKHADERNQMMRDKYANAQIWGDKAGWHEHNPYYVHFARQKGGGFTFLVASWTAFFAFYSGLHPSKRSFYETLREGRPIRLYLDLEAEREFNPTLDDVALRDSVIARVTEFLLLTFPEVKKVAHSVFYSGSDAKISWHVLFHLHNEQGLECAFASTAHAQSFMNMIFVDTDPDSPLWIHSKNETKTFFVDLGVYTMNRQWRLLYSTKIGKNRYLVPDTDRTYPQELDKQTFLHSCVGYFEDYRSLILLKPQHLKLNKKLQRTDTLVSPHLFSPFGGSPLLHSPAAKTSAHTGVHELWAPLGDFFADRWNGKGGYNQESNSLMFLSASKDCEIAQRTHVSNHVYFLVHLDTCTWKQLCHNEECKRRSISHDLPQTYIDMITAYKQKAKWIDMHTVFAHLFNPPL